MDQAVDHHAFVNVEDLVAQFFAHALVNNHVAGQFGGTVAGHCRRRW